MRKFFWLLVLLAIANVRPCLAEAEPLVAADFDVGVKPNIVGGNYGTWDYDVEDETQRCRESFESDDSQGDDMGYCVRLEYDVDSPNPAFNGFWMELKGLDASPYDVLSFWVRGASEEFTARFKVELKNHVGKRATYPVGGVTTQWQEIRIPFKETEAISDWTQLSVFVVVFDDIVATVKEGAIHIDHVVFV